VVKGSGILHDEICFHRFIEYSCACFNFASEINLTAARRRLSFKDKIMADIPSIPPLPGAPTGAN
jgi:hypothetical protein